MVAILDFFALDVIIVFSIYEKRYWSPLDDFYFFKYKNVLTMAAILDLTLPFGKLSLGLSGLYGF